MAKRGRTLEAEFFWHVDKNLVARLKAEIQAEEQQNALGRACGLHDEELLRSLVAAQITAESLIALTLVPLVRIAWADGKMAEAEREAILMAAANSHCPEGSLGYALLKSWMDQPPAERLFEVWQDYTRALCAALPEDARQTLHAQVLQRTRRVAAAAGGMLGIHRISSKEDAVLQEVERVFQTSKPPESPSH